MAGSAAVGREVAGCEVVGCGVAGRGVPGTALVRCAGGGNLGWRVVGERGAGSVLVIAVVAVGCLLAAGAAVVGQAAAAAARASSAADLAALAAQDVRWGRVPSDLAPCGAAAEVARAQGAELVTCTATEGPPGGVVEVEVVVALGGPAARWGPARAVARAGEAPEGAP